MMTVPEIREHAARLQDHLVLKRGQIRRGEYAGLLDENLALVTALEGRIAELLAQCNAVEAAVLAVV